jgi:hypothetical protein
MPLAGAAGFRPGGCGGPARPRGAAARGLWPVGLSTLPHAWRAPAYTPGDRPSPFSPHATGACGRLRECRSLPGPGVLTTRGATCQPAAAPPPRPRLAPAPRLPIAALRPARRSRAVPADSPRQRSCGGKVRGWRGLKGCSAATRHLGLRGGPREERRGARVPLSQTCRRARGPPLGRNAWYDAGPSESSSWPPKAGRALTRPRARTRA